MTITQNSLASDSRFPVLEAIFPLDRTGTNSVVGKKPSVPTEAAIFRRGVPTPLADILAKGGFLRVLEVS
jgi:hypothetical protein